MSLIISSLLLQHCPTCLVSFIWMVLEIGIKWPYSSWFAGCCFQDLFSIARSILVPFPSSFFSIRFVSILVVHLYRRIDTTAAWKKFHFILSNRSDTYMIDCLSIAVCAIAGCILISLSVDETLLPRYVNFSPNFREPLFKVEMILSWLKHMYFVLSAFT